MAIGPYLDVLDLGPIPFEQALSVQRETHNQVCSQAKNHTLILCQHPHTITLGRTSNPDNILDYRTIKDRGFDVIKGINRGGEVTYHGPGQLIGYLIFDLRSFSKDLAAYLNRIENILIDTLGHYEIQAYKRLGFRGVWSNEKKIASIGIGVSKYVTMHGFALNVNVDLKNFSLIKPCGLDIEMTSIQREKNEYVFLDQAKHLVINYCCLHFGLITQSLSEREVSYV